MAAFQKDPQVLITHQRDDVNSIADMAGKPIMISDATVGSFWLWLKAKFGFKDSSDPQIHIQLGAVPVRSNAQFNKATSRASLTRSRKQGGVAPKVFLLADAGYPGYGSFVLAREDLITEHPEIVKAFVQASIEGWRNYLEGDPAPANKLHQADNPEMTDDILAQAIEKMREEQSVIPEQGGTRRMIGQMNDERWKTFFDTMSAQGLYPQELRLQARLYARLSSACGEMSTKRAFTSPIWMPGAGE